MTRWWKCDLQVASPGEPRFRRPPGWNIGTEAERAASADAYMAAVVGAGIEVLALADHNSVEWVDTMAEAGRRHGVVVFPGFEVTSASGSDGAHLIVLSDPGRTGAELERLLYTACAYDADHPLFDTRRPAEPAPSPCTLDQILDALPDGYLAIAPHAFGDNGIASKDTVSGSLRWKALHHDRLGAIDVGDVSHLLPDSAGSGEGNEAPSWRARFVRRELGDFPCLRHLAFVSTSDAYSLDKLGCRFTWIRMESPTLEGMRQAFLDYGARMICDWDPRLAATRANPNHVSHSWVEALTLTRLATASESFTVRFDPRLTVLIGGRGAGKSTIVAALRSLYGDVNALPAQAREEASRFEDAVFASATFRAEHRLAHSGEVQRASWSRALGSRTTRADEQATATDFRVRVISQKELFERAANAPGNPHAISQNLLVLVDDAVAAKGTTRDGHGAAVAALDEARTAWVSAVSHYESERVAVAQRQQVAERVAELKRQVAAFDDESNRSRRERNDERLAEERWLDGAVQGTQQAIEALTAEARRLLPPDSLIAATPERAGDDMPGLVDDLNRLREELRADVEVAGAAAATALDAVRVRRQSSAWQQQVDAAKRDSQAYLQELAAVGLEPSAYEAVRSQLASQTEILVDLELRTSALSALAETADEAWTAYQTLLDERNQRRRAVLDEIAIRSRTLRFNLEPMSDTTAWVASVRQLLNLRADGYLEDVPALAAWLWKAQPDRLGRLRLWREACVTGDFGVVALQARLRTVWVDRLRGLDPVVRTRLAAEVAEATVAMEFRRDGLAGREEWKALTSGSPGQRSAAMLSFVLHHGSEPLVLDQPEDDLDTEWITQLVVEQLRVSRWLRQVIVVTHNANIPVNADAERIVVMENVGNVRIRATRTSSGDVVEHCGAIENPQVRSDIQQIMEGGVDAFVRRERRYNNELNSYRAALKASTQVQAGTH